MRIIIENQVSDSMIKDVICKNIKTKRSLDFTFQVPTQILHISLLQHEMQLFGITRWIRACLDWSIWTIYLHKHLCHRFVDLTKTAYDMTCSAYFHKLFMIAFKIRLQLICHLFDFVFSFVTEIVYT
jgi:hypothetical protein